MVTMMCLSTASQEFTIAFQALEQSRVNKRLCPILFMQPKDFSLAPYLWRKNG